MVAPVQEQGLESERPGAAVIAGVGVPDVQDRVAREIGIVEPEPGLLQGGGEDLRGRFFVADLLRAGEPREPVVESVQHGQNGFHVPGGRVGGDTQQGGLRVRSGGDRGQEGSGVLQHHVPGRRSEVLVDTAKVTLKFVVRVAIVVFLVVAAVDIAASAIPRFFRVVQNPLHGFLPPLPPGDPLDASEARALEASLPKGDLEGRFQLVPGRRIGEPGPEARIVVALHDGFPRRQQRPGHVEGDGPDLGGIQHAGRVTGSGGSTGGRRRGKPRRGAAPQETAKREPEDRRRSRSERQQQP
mmetsp:Transcript_22151/g.52674  ORF Transcript_22151/g.52674 Transcript_22151/m.52674 type:complete len:299 (+) Transcript_22151:226-1122(+)